MDGNLNSRYFVRQKLVKTALHTTGESPGDIRMRLMLFLIAFQTHELDCRYRSSTNKVV